MNQTAKVTQAPATMVTPPKSHDAKVLASTKAADWHRANDAAALALQIKTSPGQWL